jgi:hypothetical protein
LGDLGLEWIYSTPVFPSIFVFFFLEKDARIDCSAIDSAVTKKETSPDEEEEEEFTDSSSSSGDMETDTLEVLGPLMSSLTVHEIVTVNSSGNR